MPKKREELVRGLRGERPKRKPYWKPIAGIVVTLLTFALVCFAFEKSLAWPTSLLTLAGMLAVAWFVGVLAGERLATARWSAVASSVLALALAASTLGFNTPWRLGEGEICFSYRATFVYYGGEDSEPLENLGLYFAAPQIENGFAGTISSAWELYYVENDGSMTHLCNPGGIINLRGARDSQLVVYVGIAESRYGPALKRIIDRLYPREAFVSHGETWVPEDRADKVTLRSYGEPRDESFGYWHTPEAERENWGVDFFFSIGLYREGTLIERYEVTWENQTWGAFSLARKV